MGSLETWAGYTFPKIEEQKVAQAGERWEDSMEQMRLNYTIQEFLMLYNPKIKAKICELYRNKKMGQIKRQNLDVFGSRHLPRVNFTQMNS